MTIITVTVNTLGNQKFVFWGQLWGLTPENFPGLIKYLSSLQGEGWLDSVDLQEAAQRMDLSRRKLCVLGAAPSLKIRPWTRSQHLPRVEGSWFRVATLKFFISTQKYMAATIHLHFTLDAKFAKWKTNLPGGQRREFWDLSFFPFQAFNLYWVSGDGSVGAWICTDTFTFGSWTLLCGSRGSWANRWCQRYRQTPSICHGDRWKWKLKKVLQFEAWLCWVWETKWFSPGLCLHCWGFALLWPAAPDRSCVITPLQLLHLS